MPQNTPMKRQFTTIDGRTVMSNLPQHWGGNDWTITGVDNPLPVGNYVQTEAGVWIPQKGSDDGAADVRLTGSIVELNKGTYSPANPLEIVGGTYINLLEINTYPFKEIRGVIRFSSSVNDVAIRLWHRVNSSFSYYEHKDINGERLGFVFEPCATNYELRLENNGDDTIGLVNFEVVGLL